LINDVQPAGLSPQQLRIGIGEMKRVFERAAVTVIVTAIIQPTDFRCWGSSTRGAFPMLPGMTFCRRCQAQAGSRRSADVKKIHVVRLRKPASKSKLHLIIGMSSRGQLRAKTSSWSRATQLSSRKGIGNENANESNGRPRPLLFAVMLSLSAGRAPKAKRIAL